MWCNPFALPRLQVYYEHVQTHCGDRDSPMSTGVLPLSSYGAIEKTRDVLVSTNRATRKVLSRVSDATWWKKTLGSLHHRPAGGAAGDTEDQVREDHNEGFAKIGCHPFYESAIGGDCYINRVTRLCRLAVYVWRHYARCWPWHRCPQVSIACSITFLFASQGLRGYWSTLTFFFQK